MTIELHWWMLPIAVLVIGLWWAWRIIGDPKNDGFFNFGGIEGLFVAAGSVVAAMAICVGHWLR